MYCMTSLLKSFLAANRIIHKCTFFCELVSEGHFVTNARYGCSHACALGRSGAITIYSRHRRRSRISLATLSSRCRLLLLHLLLFVPFSLIHRKFTRRGNKRESHATNAFLTTFESWPSGNERFKLAK